MKNILRFIRDSGWWITWLTIMLVVFLIGVAMILTSCYQGKPELASQPPAEEASLPQHRFVKTGSYVIDGIHVTTVKDNMLGNEYFFAHRYDHGVTIAPITGLRPFTVEDVHHGRE